MDLFSPPLSLSLVLTRRRCGSFGVEVGRRGDHNVCHEDEFNGVAMWSFLVGCKRLVAIITTKKTSPSRLWQEDSISHPLPFIFYHGQTCFLYNVLKILLL